VKNAMTIKFRKEKETKNTVRYQEVVEEGKPPIIGTLYLQKWFAGDTETINITVDKEAGADRS
jgi:hypothetical protein